MVQKTHIANMSTDCRTHSMCDSVADRLELLPSTRLDVAYRHATFMQKAGRYQMRKLSGIQATIGA